MLTLKELPAPPSTNTLYRNVSGKGRVRTAGYATWAKAAGWQINLQHPTKIPGKVTLDIAVERQRLGSDISNRVKAIEDLLVTMGVIEDDKNVERVTVYWADVNGCTVTISPAVL